MLQLYTVELTRVITANSAHEAAEVVLAEMRTFTTDIGVFEVTNAAGDCVMTSTGDDEPEHENCACVGVGHDASCVTR